MNKAEQEAIASGAAHVDETEQLAHGYSSQSEDEALEGPTTGTPLVDDTLSMVQHGSTVHVRIGNARNASELFEKSYDSISEANQAMLDSGILKAKQVADVEKLAGTGLPVSSMTVEELEEAGFIRKNVSTL